MKQTCGKERNVEESQAYNQGEERQERVIVAIHGRIPNSTRKQKTKAISCAN